MIQSGIPVFDSVVGGLFPGTNHLLYGELGAGKSTFALQFLHWGLSRGEPALLVTRRTATDVLQQGEVFGVPLRPFVRSGKLALLEYAADVVERAARAKEIAQVADEFDYFARGRDVRRMVFDPLTPIIEGMNVSETSFRLRTLVQRFNAYQATALFLLDLPEAAEIVPSCADVMQAVLRFDVAPEQDGNGILVIERMPRPISGPRRIPYSLRAGRGIVEAVAPEASGTECRRRKILAVATEPATLSLVRRTLGDEYELTECQDVLQAVARLAVESPDLLILDLDVNGNDAVRACLELRRNQLNLPILLLGKHHRLRDRLALLAQGIDDCLEKPVDGRLLRVRVRSLVKRYSPRDRFQAQEPDRAVLASLQRSVPSCRLVPDAAGFRTCLEEEMEHARRHEVPFSVCVLEPPAPGTNGTGLMVETVQRHLRPHDKLYATSQVIAVILSETSEAGANAFLRRLQTETAAGGTARVRSFTFDGSEDFAPLILSYLPTESGSVSGRESSLEAT